MSVKSQQVIKSPMAKLVPISSGALTHSRGFAGNHTLMRKQRETADKFRAQADEGTQRPALLSKMNGLWLQRKCASSGYGGTCEEPEAGTSLRAVQKKLAVNEAGDRSEQEADRMADQALNGSAQVAAGSDTRLQRQAAGAPEPISAPPLVDQVLSSAGRSLDTSARVFMEPRFGCDFSHVRVHTDRKAAESARQVGAMAYTVGQHTVFDSERFAPHTQEGRHLLAHELAHVVQQSRGVGVGTIQRQPDSESLVTPPFKKGLGMRAPRLRLDIADPRTDSSAHTSWYRLLPGIVGLSTEWFSQKYPGFDDALYKRIVELGLTVGWQVPWMVISHEYGHYRVGDQYGWDPHVSLLKWYKGVTTSRNKAAAFNAPESQKVEFSQAGVNQERLNEMHLFVDWSLNNSIDPQEAFAFLATRTNMAFYAARSSVGGGTGAQDDLVAYAKRTGTGTEKIFVLSLASDLLSASTWGAFIPLFTKFLAKGQRRFTIPTTQIGGYRTTWPNFNVLLTSKGPIVGGQVVVGVDRDMPVEFTVETGLNAVGLGAKVHGIGIPLVGHLSASPFLHATIDNGLGAVVGTDLRYDISRTLSITGRLDYRWRKDLLDEPTGRTSDLSGGVSIGISLP